MNQNDITGERFGALTILSFLTFTDSGRRTVYRCLCDCGGEALKGVDKLRQAVREGRSPACHACVIKNKHKDWKLTREKELAGNNPNAPAEMITARNYRKYLHLFTTPEQWHRYFYLVERHRAAALHEPKGIDQIKAEAVDEIILEPVEPVAVEISQHDRRDYSFVSAGAEL